jgi:hypothetical protein
MRFAARIATRKAAAYDCNRQIIAALAKMW